MISARQATQILRLFVVVILNEVKDLCNRLGYHKPGGKFPPRSPAQGLQSRATAIPCLSPL
jgi:hypothetical protein